MGSWGYGIRHDDFVCDVIGDFEDLLKAAKSVAQTTEAVKLSYSEAIEDSDEGPLFWIALADMQWTYGQLESQVLQQIKDDLDSGRSLGQWSDDPRGLLRRKAALEKFILKIQIPNPRPKKPPKIVVRAPKFQPGDCLSIRLEGGKYAAALVLAADHSNIEYGENLIGVLDFLSEDKPSLDVFQARKWLVLTHHNWKQSLDICWYGYVGFRAVKSRLELVGKVEIFESDPKDHKSSRNWIVIGEQVVHQRKWDANSA